jgi:hypothetical protein
MYCVIASATIPTDLIRTPNITSESIDELTARGNEIVLQSRTITENGIFQIRGVLCALSLVSGLQNQRRCSPFRR